MVEAQYAGSRGGGKSLRMKALCLLKSCLSASDIPHSIISPTDLEVERREGGRIRVSIVVDVDSAPEHPNLTVSAADIVSQKREVARTALHTVTRAAGWGEPDPVSRGEDKKRPYGDSPDLVIFRHRQFRLVPNAPSEVFEEDYNQVIEMACKFFLRKNSPLCARLGYELDDLRTYARVWTNNFWGLSRLPNSSLDQNQRLLYKYLRQRFSEFYLQIRGVRSRNTIVDSESVAIGLGFIQAFDYDRVSEVSNLPNKIATSASQLSAEDLYLQAEEEQNSPDLEEEEQATPMTAERRMKARSELERRLSAMPHDAMVFTLDRARGNPYIPSEARAEARKVLDRHQASCSEQKCSEAATRTANASGPEKASLASLEKSGWITLDVDE